MPLIKSASKSAVSKNISEMVHSGHKREQAVAAALNIARKARANGGGVRVGPLKGATGGRADKIKARVFNGSHILSADCVSALGSGNTMAGHAILEKMFPGSSAKGGASLGDRRPGLLAKGGTVDVRLSDGEFCVPPSEVLRVGGGNAELGHRILDEFQNHVREQNIKNLHHLPGPEK